MGAFQRRFGCTFQGDGRGFGSERRGVRADTGSGGGGSRGGGAAGDGGAGEEPRRAAQDRCARQCAGAPRAQYKAI